MSSPAKFVLAIPHAPWNTARAINLETMMRSALVLEGVDRGAHAFFRTFTERAPWPERSVTRWKWALETAKDRGATHFVQLEDDVVLYEHFWEALHAMTTAWPEDVICLAATHSMGPLVALQGRRSYKTPKLLGWAFSFPVFPWLEKLVAAGEDGRLADYAKRPGAVEDGFLAEFFVGQGKMPRHPCPTIVDHLFLPSTQGKEFDAHTNCQATVTWRDFARADMASPEWWNTAHTTLPPEWTKELKGLMGTCHWCFERPAVLSSPKTHAGICKVCILGHVMTTLGFPFPGGPAAVKGDFGC